MGVQVVVLVPEELVRFDERHDFRIVVFLQVVNDLAHEFLQERLIGRVKPKEADADILEQVAQRVYMDRLQVKVPERNLKDLVPFVGHSVGRQYAQIPDYEHWGDRIEEGRRVIVD